MHLPFMQVANEVIDSVAIEVAAETKCSPGDAFLGVVKMQRWALARCKETAPPSAQATIHGPEAARKITMAAGLQCAPEAFTRACANAQPAVLEELSDGFRFRGLDRYDAAWRKNHKDAAAAWDAAHPETARKPPGRRPESGAEPERHRQTHMQTQTQTLPTEAVEGPAPLGATITPPEGDPESWLGTDFWSWAQARRIASGFLPEKKPHPSKLSGWWATARMMEGVTVNALREGFFRFGDDKHWESKDPPYPFAAFMSQWLKYTRPEVSHGNRS